MLQTRVTTFCNMSEAKNSANSTPCSQAVTHPSTVKSVLLKHTLCFGIVTLINYIAASLSLLLKITNQIPQSIYPKLHRREQPKKFHNLSSKKRLQVRMGLSSLSCFIKVVFSWFSCTHLRWKFFPSISIFLMTLRYASTDHVLMKCVLVIFKFKKTEKNATFAATLTQFTCTFYVALVSKHSENFSHRPHKRYINVPKQSDWR